MQGQGSSANSYSETFNLSHGFNFNHPGFLLPSVSPTNVPAHGSYTSMVFSSAVGSQYSFCFGNSNLARGLPISTAEHNRIEGRLQGRTSTLIPMGLSAFQASSSSSVPQIDLNNTAYPGKESDSSQESTTVGHLVATMPSAPVWFIPRHIAQGFPSSTSVGAQLSSSVSMFHQGNTADGSWHGNLVIGGQHQNVLVIPNCGMSSGHNQQQQTAITGQDVLASSAGNLRSLDNILTQGVLMTRAQWQSSDFRAVPELRGIVAAQRRAGLVFEVSLLNFFSSIVVMMKVPHSGDLTDMLNDALLSLYFQYYAGWWCDDGGRGEGVHLGFGWIGRGCWSLQAWDVKGMEGNVWVLMSICFSLNYTKMKSSIRPKPAQYVWRSSHPNPAFEDCHAYMYTIKHALFSG